MSEQILIQNGRIIDPANDFDQVSDLLVENGKISKIENKISISELDKSKLKIIDASNKIVCPGFIDIHVHLREPGREDKETILTASRAAAKGGITSMIAMPNTNPITDNQAVVEYVLSKAKKESLVNVFVCGSITKQEKGKEIAEIWEMKQTGIVAVSDDGFDVQNLDVYLKAMLYCKTHSMPIISHTEDHHLSEDGYMHEGEVSSKLGIKGIPACAEDAATARIISLVEEAEHQVHFTHVSTSGSVDYIRLAKAKGLNITADATPHHLALTDEAIIHHGPYAKVNPPLRSEKHRQALIKGLQDGTIDIIATDHAPHLWTEKEREFDNSPPGIVGFETMLPVLITTLHKNNLLPLSEIIRKITINPAKALKLNKGTLSPNSDADITIFDPEQTQIIDRTKFESKGQNSPFHGQKLFGKVTETIVQGKLILSNSELL